MGTWGLVLLGSSGEPSRMCLRIVRPEWDKREHLFTGSWSPVVKDWALGIDFLPPLQVCKWVSAQQVREALRQSVRGSWWGLDPVLSGLTCEEVCCQSHLAVAEIVGVKVGWGDVRWGIQCAQYILSLKYYRCRPIEVESRWGGERSREEVWWILVTPWSSLKLQSVVVPSSLFKMMISSCLSTT